MPPKAYPGHYNDLHIWLLSALLGLRHDQGPGTELDEIPRGTPASPVSHYLRADVTAQGPATEVVLQMPATTRAWRLEAITIHVDPGGSGTTFAPSIGQVAGYDAGGPDDRWALLPQPVAFAVNDVYCSPFPVRADDNFQLHLRFGFDVGADNALTYQVWLVQDFETAESTP